MTQGDINLEELARAGSNPALGMNADSLKKMIKEANGLLADLKTTVQHLESMGVFPGLMRAIGIKYNIDVETPLKTSGGITPKTDFHRTILNNMNKLSEDELAQLVSSLGGKRNE